MTSNDLFLTNNELMKRDFERIKNLEVAKGS